VRLERFAKLERQPLETPTVLVLGRVAVRKGVEDVVAVARMLHEREVDVRVRIVGGPGIWSDYTKLLEDLPPNSEYVGRIPPADIPGELARSDVLLQVSRYEPFGLTVGEALAAGVPVVATSAVGAIEGVDRSVVAEVASGDPAGMTAAIVAILNLPDASRSEIAARARAEAQRLFAPEVVCEEISAALERLLDGVSGSGHSLHAGARA
jgi:glycosyltransferase involved in cell wall biosynthesis